MRRVMSCLTEWLSSGLNPDERDAVRGDADERGLSVIRDLCSVILWRQWRAWTTRGPWVALAIVVAPLGFVLSVVSRQWAAGISIEFWLYVQNWTSGYLASPGARLDLLSVIATTATTIVALALWSWTIGYVLALLSRRASGINTILLACMVFAGTTGTTTMGVLNPANAAVFSSTFYRVGVPFAVRVLLVMVPIWRGMRAGRKETRLSLWWTAGRTVAATLLTATMWRALSGALFLGWISPTPAPGFFGAFWWARFHVWSMLFLPLFPLAMAWPPAYLLIRARRQFTGVASR